jgi:hypothetical protein
MIPFYMWLGGDNDALRRAIVGLDGGRREEVDLIGDGTVINLTQLTVEAADWILKQILQVVTSRNMPPEKDIVAYGTSLYRILGLEHERIWLGDFLPAHRRWLENANVAVAAG